MKALEAQSRSSLAAIGPEDKNLTRMDFIVDSGPSDSTLPVGVWPNHFMGEPKGYVMRSSLWQMAVQLGKQEGLVFRCACSLSSGEMAIQWS